MCLPVPQKHILVQEGYIDTVVGNRATDDLALAMRLPDLNDSLGCNDPNGCSGIWRYVMTDYGQNETDGHSVTLKVPQATQQAFEYLTSFGTVVDDASPPTPMSTSTGITDEYPGWTRADGRWRIADRRKPFAIGHQRAGFRVVGGAPR